MKQIIVMTGLICLAIAAQGASGLNKSEVAKVKRFYEGQDITDGTYGKMSPDELVGSAQNKYAKLLASEMCTVYKEACPEAYEINAYGTETIAIQTEDSSGTLSLYIFTEQGSPIASGGRTESDPFVWNGK